MPLLPPQPHPSLSAPPPRVTDAPHPRIRTFLPVCVLPLLHSAIFECCNETKDGCCGFGRCWRGDCCLQRRRSDEGCCGGGGWCKVKTKRHDETYISVHNNQPFMPSHPEYLRRTVPDRIFPSLSGLIGLGKVVTAACSLPKEGMWYISTCDETEVR